MTRAAIFNSRSLMVVNSAVAKSRGFEREIRKRLDYWAKLRRERG